MNKNRILLDTSVWISYFGERKQEHINRMELARIIINYCLEKKMTLFYCPQIEAELRKGSHATRNENIEQMKKIAEEILGHTGNEKWGQMSPVTWDKWGTKFGDKSESELGDKLESQLPDKNNKSNRTDRSILVSAIKENIHIFLHENPQDFNKIKSDEILLINLLEITSISEFVDLISRA